MKKTVLIICFNFLTINCFWGQELSTQDNVSGNLYLNGEYLFTKGDDSIKLETFKYLYKNKDVRVVAEAFPLSILYFVQKYYQTGNDSLLEIALKRSFEGNFSESYFDYKLYTNFYNALPDDNPFFIEGLSCDYPTWMPIFALHDLFSQALPPDELKTAIEKIAQLYNSIPLNKKHNWVNTKILNPYYVPDKKMEETFSFIRNDLQNNDSIYKNYFGDNYYYVKWIVEGVLVGLYYAQEEKVREAMERQFVYERFIAIAERYPQKGVFAQLPWAQVYKQKCPICEKEDLTPLAQLLNETEFSPFKSKVESTLIYYKNEKKLKKTFNKEQQKFLDSIIRNKACYVYKIDPTNSLFLNFKSNIDNILINNYK